MLPRITQYPKTVERLEVGVICWIKMNDQEAIHFLIHGRPHVISAYTDYNHDSHFFKIKIVRFWLDPIKGKLNVEVKPLLENNDEMDCTIVVDAWYTYNNFLAAAPILQEPPPIELPKNATKVPEPA